MDPIRYRRDGTVRAMLWAVAILFMLNFYMFLLARSAPVVVEITALPVEATPEIVRCDRSVRVDSAPQSMTEEMNRMRNARRILARERERIRQRCIRFADPRVSVLVTTASSG